MTDGGVLRHASFKGLREDLLTPAPEARAEAQRAPKRAARAAPSRVRPEIILQLLPDAVAPS
jgi:hypothetical protein